MSIKVGDRVETIDDSLAGKVTAIREGVLYILTDDGFELELSQGEVVKINDPSLLQKAPLDVDKHLPEKEGGRRRRKATFKPKERDAPRMEVDLHIHQLVPSTRGMTSHDMLTIQLDTARRQLEFAIRKRIQKVVFIHGVGEGVLKTELEYLFGRYDNVKFYAADFRKYGLGATEVYIFQNG
ncbi:Smr/MutS family protein [Sinomicrobium weinanense]|uniref:DNA mismatch repair protein MutS n=1 Tax=Sinomicrobium weinanense TaxID=2842200 RepID=A0A926JUA3_9FLAO|nr:Smr/MutS family protein [Sinomicrobium weinanense]MBC9797373.1 DNA mismatch repair protein MutS [Sinomicrobium weinanense]MBU3123396.1 DNA mismatch repair protein MutS [Sinomicrobium weinanense]